MINQYCHHHRAFTLFEVAISLALVSFGVVSVLMLLPSGIKAQQMARYQIIASAKAMEVVEAYNATHNGNPAVDVEADQPWNVHSTAKNMQPDLESRVSSYRYGMFPLPLDIARRIDSDGDEIQRVLGEGGYLYYSQPLATTGFQENGFAPTAPPNEAQRLVMAVVGYPQNNSLLALPQKAWPYYVAYPSPPMHIIHRGGLGSAGTDIRPAQGWKSMLWEDVNLGADTAGLRQVYNAYWAYTLVDGEKTLPSAGGAIDADLKSTAQAYGDAAVAWCLALGLPPTCYDGSTALTDFPSADRRHLQTIAARIMGHVGPIMLATQNGNAGVVTINAMSVANMHENALTLGFKFAASYPYDWGVPRPLQRATMMDYPLIEYDLMVDPENPLIGDPKKFNFNTNAAQETFKGVIFGSTSPGKVAYQWHPVTPHPVVNAGVSVTYPSLPGGGLIDWAKVWGPTQHSTLTARFDAAERCRQIVFWAVDWQSYEDFETAPSAPVDAGRYAKYAPHAVNFQALCGHSVNGVRWMDHHQFGYRNPEKMIVFNGDMSGLPTGTSTPSGKSGGTRGIHPGVQGVDDYGNYTADQGLGPTEISRFMGRWGADRNANQKLDRGQVPKSVRLRAATVARFNYYDMRVPATIR